MRNSFKNKKKLRIQKCIQPSWDALEYFQVDEQSSSTLPKHVRNGLEINNSQDDLGYHSLDSGHRSLVNTPERRQSQESVTNTSQEEVEGLVQSTPIKRPRKEGGDEYLLECDVSVINKTLEQYQTSKLQDEGYHSSTHSNSTVEEDLQENSTSRSSEQEIEGLPQIMEVENQSKKQKSKKSHIFNCVAGGGVGLAVAYFVGAALTSIYVAISVFVGMAFVVALLGYGIAKLYDKVGTKIENPCMAEYSVNELAV